MYVKNIVYIKLITAIILILKSIFCVLLSVRDVEMEEFFRDFDWELDRFVEYRSPFTRKETLPIKNPL
jgi:hypothetical protein